jgi:hypothetical protein
VLGMSLMKGRRLCCRGVERGSRASSQLIIINSILAEILPAANFGCSGLKPCLGTPVNIDAEFRYQGQKARIHDTLQPCLQARTVNNSAT